MGNTSGPFRNAARYMMEEAFVIKIGSVLDDEAAIRTFSQDVASTPVAKILVHGGGRRATEVASALDVASKMVNGRRITDDRMLEVVTMVYAGLINKQLVALLQSAGIDALGLSGADGNVILAEKRPTQGEVDYGWAGDIKAVNIDLLRALMDGGSVPVLNAITHDGNGQLLNTNADTIASRTASCLAEAMETHLVFLFDFPGVLKNIEDPKSLITHLNFHQYEELKARGEIIGGMLPKLENAFSTIKAGVSSVRIGAIGATKDILEGQGPFTLLTP